MKPSIGIFSKTTDSSLVEAIGRSGIDFIIFDQEHGYISNETLVNHIRAANITGMKPVVRIPYANLNSIGTAFDLGAEIVMIPNVTSNGMVKECIELSKFKTSDENGARGVCRFVRAAAYGRTERNEYFMVENSHKRLILQIEGEEGIFNLPDILEACGTTVHSIFIGPYDLASSLGVPGEISSNRVVTEILNICKEAKKQNILVGSFSDSTDYTKFLLTTGIKFIAQNVDLSIMRDACLNLKENFYESQ